METSFLEEPALHNIIEQMMVRIFKHYLPIQIIILAAVDLLILVGSMYLGVQVRFFGGDLGGSETILPIWPKAGSYAAVIFTIMTAMGLYERDLFEGRWEYYARFMMSYAIGLIAMLALFYVFPGLFLGRGAFALTMLFSMLGAITARGNSTATSATASATPSAGMNARGWNTQSRHDRGRAGSSATASLTRVDR